MLLILILIKKKKKKKKKKKEKQKSEEIQNIGLGGGVDRWGILSLPVTLPPPYQYM